MNKTASISKRDAGLRQLETAIRLFFSDADAISVHTLAAAARTVFNDLCVRNDIEPFFEHICATLQPDSPKELRDLLNKFQNFFKHADKDPFQLLQDFDDEANEWMLYIAVEDAHRLLVGLSVSAQIFQAWFCACYPERLAPDVTTDYASYFPDIREMNRAERKRQGLAKITEHENNELLLDHPGTIRTPWL